MIIKKKKAKKDVERVGEKNQIKQENKILRGILIIVGVIIVIVVAWFITSQSVSTFEYENIEFEIVKEGDLIFYRTALPTMYQGQLTEYSFYLRNDARNLNVPFSGELDLKNNVVLNLREDFNCGGEGIIAVANLLKLYQFIGINVLADENATCDPEARYTVIQILEGPVTKLETKGQSCYDLFINDCEIIEGTEKLMIEALNKVKAASPDYKYD